MARPAALVTVEQGIRGALLLIMVNGAPVDFSYRMQDGDRVSIFPHFHIGDIAAPANLQVTSTPATRFIADAHLGQLAKYLRMLGFDVLYLDSGINSISMPHVDR